MLAFYIAQLISDLEKQTQFIEGKHNIFFGVAMGKVLSYACELNSRLDENIIKCDKFRSLL